MTLDSLKLQIRNQLVTQKLIETLASDAKVSEADIQAYYDTNKAQFFQKEAKKASHILFKPEDKATAEKVLAEVKAGGNFEALAKKYSVDTATASKGGDLGWPTSAYVPEFEAALAKLSKGETSALVQSPYGWHIIRVTDRACRFAAGAGRREDADRADHRSAAQGRRLPDVPRGPAQERQDRDHRSGPEGSGR